MGNPQPAIKYLEKLGSAQSSAAAMDSSHWLWKSSLCTDSALRKDNSPVMGGCGRAVMLQVTEPLHSRLEHLASREKSNSAKAFQGQSSHAD